MSRKFFVISLILAGGLFLFLLSKNDSVSLTGRKESSPPKQVSFSTQSSSFVAPTDSKSSTQVFRRQYEESTDLRALYEKLSASNEPGSMLYANLAKAECLLFSAQFGQGSEAWEKFYKTVSDSAPDRIERVSTFQSLTKRCEKFEPNSDSMVLSLIKASIDKDSKDPLVRLQLNLQRAGKQPNTISYSDFSAYAASALLSKDPDLIASLGASIFGRNKLHGVGIGAPDEEIADRLAWGAAIERSYGQAPVSYRSMQIASCIVGHGCDKRPVLEASERSMRDLPPERSKAILARANQLAPQIQAALDSRSVESVLALGSRSK